MEKRRRRISGWKAKLLSWGGKLTVISSILNSVPIYALTVLPAPKKVFASIQRSIADFLWNQGDMKRMHWVSWNKVSKPVEKGGLNLKILADCNYFWKSKLAWSFLQNNSLWSKFMNQKYKLGTAGILDSKLWKELVPIVSDLETESFWKVGKGQIKFWSQRWWPMEINLQNLSDLPDRTLAKIWTDNDTRSRYLVTLPIELQQYANTVSLNSSDDILIWKNSVSGVFNSREFRTQHISNSGEGISWWKNFWQPWIPTKSSCFLWKCMNRAVPVDEVVQRAKIPFVSKCSCCSTGHQETLNHLFLFSEVAVSVWNFLNRIFGITVQYQSIYQAAVVWIKHSSTRSQFGCLRIIAFVMTVWEIWKWRNKAIFEKAEDPDSIKHRVISHLQSLNCLIVPGRQTKWMEEMVLQCLHIPRIKHKQRRGKWIKWSLNPEGFTINFYGSAKSELNQGGFVIRDKRGSVLWSGSKRIPGNQDLTHILLITLRAALDSVGLSAREVSEIQSSDRSFIQYLTGLKNLPWRWADQLQELKFRCAGICLKLVEKESNRVAELMANGGGDNGQDPDIQRCPKVKAAILEEMEGMARWSP